MVSAARRRDRVLHPDAADHPHLHLAAGGRRAHAVLALHRADPGGLRALGDPARPDRPRGRRQLGGVARPPPLPRLRRDRRDRDRRRLPADSPAARAGPARRRPGRRRTLARRAAAAGPIQGPAELLPVSSSAHLNLVPWLAGWEWRDADPEARKSFEVAVHAGGAAALLIGQRRADRRASCASSTCGGPPWWCSRSCRPRSPAICFEREIERRLGGPRATAAGLVAGSVAMVAADRSPQERGRGDAGALDGLALGVGQAAALAPGVSRNGATLAAARWRRFTRPHANLLSRTVALPVIVGAALLKGVRLRRRGVGPGPARGARDGRRRLVRLDAGVAAADRRSSSATGRCGPTRPTGSRSRPRSVWRMGRR